MPSFVLKQPDIGDLLLIFASIMNQTSSYLGILEADEAGKGFQGELYLQADAAAGEDDGIEILRARINRGSEGLFHADG